MHLVVQEREKRKEEWKPRFFNRTAESEVFPTEWPDAECPLWKYNGEYLKLDPRPSTPEGKVLGKSTQPAGEVVLLGLHAVLHCCHSDACIALTGLPILYSSVACRRLCRTRLLPVAVS